MKLFGHAPTEYKRQLSEDQKYSNVTYKKWLLERKQPPGMLEIYAQHLFGAIMGQTFPALFVFEWLLNFHSVEQIVEIGTGCGGLTTYLQLQANIRGLDFVTYDANCRLDDKNNKIVANPPLHMRKFINFRKGNVFEDDVRDEIRALLKKKVTLLYCDNGNKPKEIKTFSPHCLKGSIIGTHDWHGHFQVEGMVRELGMKLLFEDICIEGMTKMRFWKKEL